jgi:ABC-type polysaccharide/polyol phosphate transport system ATPase subunit
MSENVIELQNVSKSFQMEKAGQKSTFFKIISKKTKISALDNVSLSVKKGEVLGIIGNNGSGKTTLLRTIAGIYQADSGKIKINGKIAPLLHIGTGFNKELNAKENITISGLLLGLKRAEIEKRVPKIIQYAELEKFSQMPLKHYSTGMKARLAFSLALQADSDIMLIDEILSVGDKKFREKSFESFLSFKNKGKTILLVTHNIGSKLKIADRVLLMEKGKVSMIGNPEEVIQKYTSDQNNKKKAEDE